MIEVSKISTRFEVRRMQDSDTELILELCRGNTQYYRYCGMQPSREQVLKDLHIVPPGTDPADKYYVGFFRDGKLMAVMDFIDGYPTADTGYIGFFMIHAAEQGKQIGSGIIREACAYWKQSGLSAIRLGIAEDNPQARHFWHKNGFLVIDRVPMDGWTALAAEKRL